MTLISKQSYIHMHIFSRPPKTWSKTNLIHELTVVVWLRVGLVMIRWWHRNHWFSRWNRGRGFDGSIIQNRAFDNLQLASNHKLIKWITWSCLFPYLEHHTMQVVIGNSSTISLDQDLGQLLGHHLLEFSLLILYGCSRCQARRFQGAFLCRRPKQTHQMRHGHAHSSQFDLFQ